MCRVYPVANLESIRTEATMEPTTTDNGGANEHPEHHVAPSATLHFPPSNHRLALSERDRLSRDPGHPRSEVFDALGDGDAEGRRIDGPPWPNGKTSINRVDHRLHAIEDRRVKLTRVIAAIPPLRGTLATRAGRLSG